MSATREERARRALARHNRRSIEAGTPAPKLARMLVAASPPWPRRRFRVEGTIGGPTALMRRERAERVVARWGGRVVEILPPYRAWRAAGGRR